MKRIVCHLVIFTVYTIIMVLIYKYMSFEMSVFYGLANIIAFLYTKDL